MEEQDTAVLNSGGAHVLRHSPERLRCINRIKRNPVLQILLPDTGFHSLIVFSVAFLPICIQEVDLSCKICRQCMLLRRMLLKLCPDSFLDHLISTLCLA